MTNQNQNNAAQAANEKDDAQRVKGIGPAYPYTPNTASPTPLPKLRAPVADEWAAFEKWHVSDFGRSRVTFRQGDTARWEGWRGRAALASAPVAGEAVAEIVEVRGETRLLHKLGFSQLPNGTKLYAAPQASEAVRDAAQTPLLARALAEWHEDDGPVTWWAWCGHEWAGEAPWCGTPLDQDWPGYHTHWTPIPGVPFALSAQPGAQKGGSQ